MKSRLQIVDEFFSHTLTFKNKWWDVLFNCITRDYHNDILDSFDASESNHFFFPFLAMTLFGLLLRENPVSSTLYIRCGFVLTLIVEVTDFNS